MHVVLLPSFYSTPANPVAGSFFKEQAHALRRLGLKVGVVAVPEKAPWQPPRGPGRWPNGMMWEDDDGLPTLRGYRRRLWPGYHWLRLEAWVEWGVKVFGHYVEQCGLPDIVHAHVADPAGLLGARLKEKTGVPMVLTEHASWLAQGSAGKTREAVARMAYAAADAGAVVSPGLGDLLSKRYPPPQGGWRWIPNLVDDRFLRPPISMPERSTERCFSILSVGWLTPIKGHDLLLRAFANAFEGDSSAILRIGGSGPREKALRNLARTLGVERQVLFLGRLSREEVVAELARANVFVMPSYFETFGVALIEAMAMGRPVVATACGGPEFFVRQSEGILVPPGDVDAMTRALQTMKSSEGLYSPEQIRRSTRERFGPMAVGQQIAALYREVLGA